MRTVRDQSSEAMLGRLAPIAGLLLVTAAIPAMAAGPPEGPGPPDDAHSACLPGDVVDNEDIRIWFHGAKFQLKLFKKNESTEQIDGEYQYKSTEIAEQDEEGDDVAELKLENANPQNSECEVEESGNFTNVTCTAVEPLRSTDGQGGTVGDATVEFVYHFNESDESAKFELNVQEWPWQSNETGLAYEFDVTSDWVIEPAENGLGFRDEETNESEAFIEWAQNATARYEDGHNETAVVDASTTGSDHHTTTLRFTNVTSGHVELDYDARVSSGPYVIALDVLIPLTDVPPILHEPVQTVADATA
jgi:hypothetical protein